MTTSVALKFDPRCVTLDLSQIKPLKPAIPTRNAKYVQIVASIREVGLVESPVVLAKGDDDEGYYLLDGHIRVQALRELQVAQVRCLVASEDDTYTYNRQINRLPPVQDHKMIAAAIKQGVPAGRLARALGMTMQSLTRRLQLLEGVSGEVAALMADKQCPTQLFGILRQMKPARQLEAFELMQGQGNFTVSFARAILASTPKDMMMRPERARTSTQTKEQLAQMERELTHLQTQIASVEANYGPDVLKFTVIKNYLAELLAHDEVSAFLASRYPELLGEFRRMVDSRRLPQPDQTEATQGAFVPAIAAGGSTNDFTPGITA